MQISFESSEKHSSRSRRYALMSGRSIHVIAPVKTIYSIIEGICREPVVVLLFRAASGAVAIFVPVELATTATGAAASVSVVAVA